MGKIVIRIPLVTWRDGRPRFIASAAHRALGYKGEDLRHGPAGPWYSLDEAIRWSTARTAEIAARRAAIAVGATTAKKTRNAVAKARADGLVTVGQVVASFLDKSPRMQGVIEIAGKRRRHALAPNTIRFYRATARVIEQFDAGHVWTSPAEQLTGRALDGVLRLIEEQRGLAQARAVRALVSAAFRHGRIKHMVAHDPLAGSEESLPMPDARVRPASVAEIDAFLRGADALGWPDLADAVCVGVWTGQRQADRLGLALEAMSGDGMLFSAGKKNRQGKRENLLIPVSRAVEARCRAARARRAVWPHKPATLLCEPRTRRPWQADWYRKVFRVVRDAIATGGVERDAAGLPTKDGRAILGDVDVKAALAAAGVPVTPSLATLRDQDLRDTTLSWLPLAGADKWEIAGFSGHAFGKDDGVLRHYLAIPPEFARAGMKKLEAWHATRLAELRGEEDGTGTERRSLT